MLNVKDRHKQHNFSPIETSENNRFVNQFYELDSQDTMASKPKMLFHHRGSPSINKQSSDKSYLGINEISKDEIVSPYWNKDENLKEIKMDQVIKNMVSNSHFEYSLKNNLTKVLSEKTPIYKDDQKSTKSHEKSSAEKKNSKSLSKSREKKISKSIKRTCFNIFDNKYFENKNSRNYSKEHSKFERSSSPSRLISK